MRAILFALVAAASLAADASEGRSKITLKYGDAQIMVFGQGSGVPTAQHTAKFPKAAQGAPLTAEASDTLQITFSTKNDATGEEFHPHQAFVQLVNTQSGVVTTFVASPDATGQAGRVGVHKLRLSLNDRKSLHTAAVSGEYKVQIVVGDAAVSNSAVWPVGTVKLNPAAPASKPAPPLYSTPLLHESDTTLKPLKEIEHQFRQPEKRPPAIVSIAAAAVIVLGLAVFVVQAMRVPGFTRSFSVPTSALLWTVGFYASFGAVLGLFTMYWFSLNMFTTLGYLAVLSIPTFLFGHRMLSSIQQV